MNNEQPFAHWRIILAAFLDFLTASLVLGYVIALLFGGINGTGFQLTGFPAILSFVLIIAYFWAGKKYFGGTVWKRILKVR